MEADTIDEVEDDSHRDSWVRELVDRIASGDGDVHDMGRLALRLAELGEHERATKVLARIPADSATHETVAERLGLSTVTAPAHSSALGDAFAHAFSPRSLAIVVLAATIPAATALAASFAGGEAGAFVWLLLAHASLVATWPALRDLARDSRSAGFGERLASGGRAAWRDWRFELGVVGAATGPALLTGLVLPGAGMILLVTGLAVFTALALTEEGRLVARFRSLRELRRAYPAEVSLAASTGALWGIAALAGHVLARTGALGIVAASIGFFACASLCARLAAGARLRISADA